MIDLGVGVRALCLQATETAPTRPHMILFNTDHTRAYLSFVTTGHVVVFDAVTRTPIRCIDVGAQAHAATPSPDGNYLIVANQSGKLLQRINIVGNEHTLDAAATLNLSTGTTPSGADIQDAAGAPVAVRPDNAPICPIIASDSRLVFVTLRGGGLLVVDGTTTPLSILAEYDRTTVQPNGCGGVERGGRMYLNSGGGTTANPFSNDVYSFTLSQFSTTPQTVANTPAPAVVLSRTGSVDSHGATPVGTGRYLWFADRAANAIDVVDTETGGGTDMGTTTVVSPLAADPAPDLLDVSPDGLFVYASLRGPRPLTANAPENNAVGDSPGVLRIRVESNGTGLTVDALRRITNVDAGGLERADPHGLRVRRKADN